MDQKIVQNQLFILLRASGRSRSFVSSTKIPFRVKKICIATLLMAGFCYGKAQVTVKKDVTAYLRQLPAPPATLENAYKNCHCVSASGAVQASGANVAAGVHDAVMADAKSMGTLTNTENQQLQQAKTLYNQSQADNVKGMSKDQQLTWVQNNMQGYGNTAQAAAFAQNKQCKIIGLSGFSGGKLKAMADVSLHVPYENYGLVEDAHQVMMHVLAQYHDLMYRKRI